MKRLFKVILLFGFFLFSNHALLRQQCMISSLTTNITNCVSVPTASFSIEGVVSFNNAPATGQLTVSNCYGQQQIFNAPFGTSVNYSMTQLPQNGNGCDIIAVFSDDITCTMTTSVISPAIISNITTDCTFGSGEVNGTISFSNPPNGANLVIEVSDGTITVSDIISMPAPSPQNWIVGGLDPSANPYTITYYFDNYTQCANSLAINCGCSAEGGTSTNVLTGDGINNFVLCANDQIDINTNNDYVLPDDIGPIGPNALGYQPAYAYLVYSCPPISNVFPASDPCLLAVVNQTDDLLDINEPNSLFNQLGGAATFTNNQVYYAPVTLYHYDPIAPNYTLNSNCWSLGEVSSVTYLDSITEIVTSDCNTNTLTVNFSGGYPALNGSSFSASSLQPTSASFVNNTCFNGGNIVIENLENGDNWSFEIIDDNGCPKTISGGPFEGRPSIISIDTTHVDCFGDCTGSMVINASQATSYSIDNGITSSPNNTFDDLCSGSYDLVIENASGCSVVENIVLIEPTPISVTMIAKDQTCFGLCDGEISAVPSGGTAPYLFTWGLNNIGSTSLIDSLCEDQYDLTIIDDKGCELDTFALVLDGPTVPQVTFTADVLSGCAPLLVNFSANNVVSDSTCSWVFGDGSTSNDCNLTSHVFREVGCWDVQLTTENSLGCESSSMSTNYICTYDLPVADFYANPEETTVLNPDIGFINTSSEDANNFKWNLDQLNTNIISSEFEIDYDFNSIAGEYLVCLTAENMNSCKDSICKTVIINDETIIYVPNTFTPGNDGVNEVFMPVASGILVDSYELLIYNRWGELIFRSTEIDRYWDGSHKGVPCQQDVYVWTISFKNSKGKINEKIGHVNLMR